MSSSPPPLLGSEDSDPDYHPARDWTANREEEDDDDDEEIPDLESPEERARSDNESDRAGEDDGSERDDDDDRSLSDSESHDGFPADFNLGDIEEIGGLPRLLDILAGNGPSLFIDEYGDVAMDDSDDDEFERRSRYQRSTRRRGSSANRPKVPSDQGTELMRSGQFGNNPYYVDELRKRKKALATKLMWRELGIHSNGTERRANQSIAQDMIPGSVADKIVHYNSRCYSGEFSDDGNFFFCCSQDFKIRMYDTSNPYEWEYYKVVDHPFGQWTITDATLSPDNRFLAYSTIRNLVCLASTDPADQSDPSILDFSATRGQGDYSDPYFGIYSVRFSGDGRELVAGTGEDGFSVVVYDLETRQAVVRLQNHEDDVNAVCFGDVSSPHILYSGSDDTTLRVWDRRSMGDGREAGVFIGHTEGLTYIDSKGDGRYVLSNGKDQSMKLWDLRKMMTTARYDSLDAPNYRTGFDYRWDLYPEHAYTRHPHDCSVVTFCGHKVLKTLIRCHFSPPGSTNSRYVYTGSQDGKVYVYNLDATLAKTIDVGQATHGSGSDSTHGGMWETCVRDASWHPNAPVLAATSWNGSLGIPAWGPSAGTCTLHTWNDNATEDEGYPPVGRNYDSKLRPLPEYISSREGYRAFPRRRRPGIFFHDLH